MRGLINSNKTKGEIINQISWRFCKIKFTHKKDFSKVLIDKIQAMNLLRPRDVLVTFSVGSRRTRLPTDRKEEYLPCRLGNIGCAVFGGYTSDHGLVLIDAGMSLDLIKQIDSSGMRFDDIQHCILTLSY